MGTIQGYCADCRIYSRVHELCGGHRVQDLEGSNRLEAQSSIIQGNRSELEVDMFASRLSIQLPRVFSWRPDPMAVATDAFNQQCGNLKGYANPPWCLIGRILSQVENQQVLVAPVWKGQPWYPVLLGMLYNYLWQLPRSPSLPGIAVRAQRGPDGFSIPNSRVACLQQKFGCGNLSESAKELILSSWRGKNLEPMTPTSKGAGLVF